MDWSKLNKLVEAVNTYYAFAVLLYVAVIYVSKNSQLFLLILLALTPLIAGWTGYLLHSYMQGRNQKHGFRLLSQVMTYEVRKNNKYFLRYTTTLRAEANRMMVYPIGYQWSGSTQGEVPTILNPEHRLVGVVQQYDPATHSAKVSSHTESVSSEDDWNYWFVGFNKALYKGDVTEIKYAQGFDDKSKLAKPCLYYLVNTPMDTLELNVKFPADQLPTVVTSSCFKLSDRRRSYPGKGLDYNPEKQWATWSIDKPKVGHCYRIDWR